jgi:hypothetical protein
VCSPLHLLKRVTHYFLLICVTGFVVPLVWYVKDYSTEVVQAGAHVCLFGFLCNLLPGSEGIRALGSTYRLGSKEWNIINGAGNHVVEPCHPRQLR